jgi:hypothetical protein
LLSRRWPLTPPHFVGIGAQRAGTSWWHGLIESHPQVHALGWPYKELHFFDQRQQLETADVRAYHEFFRRPPGRIAGEWTPRYMYDAHTPALLRAAAPDARLLVLLRDPVARFRSGLAHDGAPEDALRRGLYHAQLTNVLASFPREQVLVLQFERAVADPAAELARTYAFLGLAQFVPRALREPVNRSRGAVAPLAAEDAVRLASAYAPDVAALAATFPEIDLALWPETTALLGR